MMIHNTVRSTLKWLRTLPGNSLFNGFLAGFLCCAMLYSKLEGNYQNRLFRSLHQSVQAGLVSANSPDSVMVRCMHFSHYLLERRRNLFENTAVDRGLDPDFLHPVTVDLMTADGVCGSYSIVLANLLRTFGYKVRIAQMQVRGVFGGHIVVEADGGRGWVVLDPLYDLCFRRPGGHGLANFRDVQLDWASYSPQTPSGYNPSYRYENVRYTNWQKIPVLMPAAKQLLTLFLGSAAADTFCLRVMVLNVNECLFDVLLAISLLILLVKVFRHIRRRSPTRDAKRSGSTSDWSMPADKRA